VLYDWAWSGWYDAQAASAGNPRAGENNACLQFDCRCDIFTRFASAGVAQLVEHLICNQRVGGSIPSAS
jgi:hypothetical protein